MNYHEELLTFPVHNVFVRDIRDHAHAHGNITVFELGHCLKVAFFGDFFDQFLTGIKVKEVCDHFNVPF